MRRRACVSPICSPGPFGTQRAGSSPAVAYNGGNRWCKDNGGGNVCSTCCLACCAFSVRALDGGVAIANSSDSYPFEPVFGFWELVARKDGFSGRTIGPDQKLTRAQALKASTINGARAAFGEGHTGSIEAGKYADLAILSADIMTVAEDRIRDTKVLATLLAGKPVHDTGLF